MYEVELKVRADHDAVRARLAELDADHLGSVTQVDTYYDAPHRDFAETDEALRLRRTKEADGEPSYLTYKGPLVEANSKTRAETEGAVLDADATDDILRQVGFDRAATVRKERDRYFLGGYHVVLDEVAGLGQFVEVEAEANEDSIEDVREGAIEVLERLGLDADEQIRTSYLGMLIDDGSSDDARGDATDDARDDATDDARDDETDDARDDVPDDAR